MTCEGNVTFAQFIHRLIHNSKFVACTMGDAGELASDHGQSLGTQGIEPRTLTLHSDRGTPMTSKCTAQLLADLGTNRSLSRPRSQ